MSYSPEGTTPLELIRKQLCFCNFFSHLFRYADQEPQHQGSSVRLDTFPLLCDKDRSVQISPGVEDIYRDALLDLYHAMLKNNVSVVGLSLRFGGLSKLLFQNSITYFLVNQSLI